MLQTPEDQSVQVGDIKTRYWHSGNQGSVVVLIHGLGSAIETWIPNVAALAEYHRVYALDLVGSGRTDKPDGSYSLIALAQFVKAFADVLNLDRFTPIGNSLGGGVALQFALLFPQRVEKLVLVNSLGFGQAVFWGLRLANLPFVEQVYQPTRSSVALTLKLSVDDPTKITEDWIDTFYELLRLPNAPKALIAQIRATIDAWGVRPDVYQPILDRLPTLTAPTLILWGKQDQVLPVAQAEIGMQHLPNARLKVFDRCGHWTHFEQAAEFNRLVAQFLAES